ncbi:MAG: tRNA 4-thiouridine(8) synthase ThiI [Candidatus Omnitrophica bacterium]|nr:tRNA 4-thiouridine(8) synthase ThiI [Candidatus Omnitrophota bacterium]
MRAITLISGGLDSILAARIIQEQGIDVWPLNFKIPFCQRKNQSPGIAGAEALTKNSLGKDLKTVDLGVGFLELVLKPKYGFGANMNPCIDCRIFMLKRAKELLEPLGAQFIVTGEVLGQRPMSQHRKALEIIEKESGLEGLLLRPLCAGLLPETLPEKQGWVKRQRLFKFSGRERRPQIKLAKEFHIANYPNPAGGCLLTDPRFSNRLKDLINCRALNIENVGLLKIGRHFRLSKQSKLIVGRNEGENQELERLAGSGDYLFMPGKELAGPTCLGRGEFSPELIRLSSAIACRYCDLNTTQGARIIYHKKGDSPLALEVSPLGEPALKALRL